jgi:hypothetical protein
MFFLTKPQNLMPTKLHEFTVQYFIFIILQVDESLYDSLMFFADFRDYNFGTVMLYDYSDEPSKTNYNKLRMKSWMNVLERMTS